MRTRPPASNRQGFSHQSESEDEAPALFRSGELDLPRWQIGVFDGFPVRLAGRNLLPC